MTRVDWIIVKEVSMGPSANSAGSKVENISTVGQLVGKSRWNQLGLGSKARSKVRHAVNMPKAQAGYG